MTLSIEMAVLFIDAGGGDRCAAAVLTIKNNGIRESTEIFLVGRKWIFVLYVY